MFYVNTIPAFSMHLMEGHVIFKGKFFSDFAIFKI